MNFTTIKFVLLINFFLCVRLFGATHSYQVEITGIFQDEESIILIINSDEEYKTSIKFSPSQEKQTVNFSIQRQESIPIKWINVFFQSGMKKDILLEHIRIKNNFVINSDNIIKSFLEEYNYNIEASRYQHNGTTYCCLHKKTDDEYIYLIFVVTDLIQNSRPIGLQLFLRLSLLATLLILTLILTLQAPALRLPLFAIALFLATFPLKVSYNTWPMAFMLLAIVIAFVRDGQRRFVWQPVFTVLCVLYLLYLTGLLYTGDLQLSIDKLNTGAQFVLFPVVFSMLHLSKRNMILILRFFVWTAMAYCAFALLSYATIVPEFTWDMMYRDSKLYAPLLTMWPSHAQPSYVSIILLMAVPTALYMRFHEKAHITLAETILGVLLPVMYAVLTGVRIGIVLVPTLLLLGYVFYCRFKPLLKWGLMAAGILVVAAGWYTYPQADDRFTDPVRVDLRKIAISAIKEKPVFGWGTGYTNPLIHSEERVQSLGIERTFPADVKVIHNQYLDYMVQFGIPGIVVFLLLLGWILWSGISERNYLLLSFLIIYLLFFYTETALSYSKGIAPFTFWLCFLMTNRAPQTNSA